MPTSHAGHIAAAPAAREVPSAIDLATARAFSEARQAAITAAKTLVHRLLGETRITVAELGEAAGVSPSVVKRWTDHDDPAYRPHVDQIALVASRGGRFAQFGRDFLAAMQDAISAPESAPVRSLPSAALRASSAIGHLASEVERAEADGEIDPAEERRILLAIAQAERELASARASLVALHAARRTTT